MVHGNNCTTDSNAWVSVLKESAMLLGADVSDGDIYTKLYEKSLQGDADCGGVLVCNYLAGEVITHIENGRPLVVRRPDSRFTLANFFRSILYSTMATLKLGMDILEKENVKIDSMTGHGGLFKTPKVGQTYMSCVCSGAPITCMKTAGEGGPYGMALLAAYACDKNDGETLEEYLDNRVFKNAESVTVKADQSDIDGFDKYMEEYKKLLEIERTASEMI
jgi:sugar (pentulose or hexulose) kinase